MKNNPKFAHFVPKHRYYALNLGYLLLYTLMIETKCKNWYLLGATTCFRYADPKYCINISGKYVDFRSKYALLTVFG